MRGKWKKRYRSAKGKLGCYSSKEIGLTADDGGEIAWGKRTVVNVAEVLSSDDDDNGWGRTVMEFIEHCRAKGFDMGEKTNWRSLGADTGKGPQGPPGVLERTASPTSLHKGQEWVLTAVKNPGRLSITYRVEARLMKEMAQDMSGSYRSVRHTSPYFPLSLSISAQVFLTGVWMRSLSRSRAGRILCSPCWIRSSCAAISAASRRVRPQPLCACLHRRER